MNTEYRKALALSLKAYKGKKQLTPLEVSQLRDIYDRHALDFNKQTQTETNTEIKDMCEKLIAERFKGKISQKHFAYTIIETLKKNNYTKCSPKQLAIIEEAYKIISGTPKNNDEDDDKKAKTTVISDADIDASLSGTSYFSGELFEDGDDE